jgi:hypothetical protein
MVIFRLWTSASLRKRKRQGSERHDLEQAHAGQPINLCDAIQSLQVAVGGADVKPECVLVAVVASLALMSVTPALAAPRQIEESCLEQAARHGRFEQRGAGEAFMANCIANNTPTPTKKLKYRKH